MHKELEKITKNKIKELELILESTKNDIETTKYSILTYEQELIYYTKRIILEQDRNILKALKKALNYTNENLDKLYKQEVRKNNDMVLIKNKKELLKLSIVV